MMHPLEYVFGGKYAPISLWFSALLLLSLIAIILFGGESLGVGKRKQIIRVLQIWYGESWDIPIAIFLLSIVFFIIPTLLGDLIIGIVVSIGWVTSCFPFLIPQPKCYREQNKKRLEMNKG